MPAMTDFQLLRDLRRLRAQAPPSLAPAVLADVGLLDSYASMDSAIGPMFVAFGADGITAVVPADDEVAFVTRYGQRHGRPLRRVDAVPSRLLRKRSRLSSRRQVSATSVNRIRHGWSG